MFDLSVCLVRVYNLLIPILSLPWWYCIETWPSRRQRVGPGPALQLRYELVSPTPTLFLLCLVYFFFLFLCFFPSISDGKDLLRSLVYNWEWALGGFLKYCRGWRKFLRNPTTRIQRLSRGRTVILGQFRSFLHSSAHNEQIIHTYGGDGVREKKTSCKCEKCVERAFVQYFFKHFSCDI